MSQTQETPTVDLATPVETFVGEATTEIPESMARATAALAGVYPPTNQRIVINVIDFWADVASPTDPIVKMAAAWLNYLLHDDVTQLDAGLTMDLQDEFTERLEELGLEELVPEA